MEKAPCGLGLGVCLRGGRGLGLQPQLVFYPLNNWGDAQCFFTVGKSMVRGQVLYRDIYEQKGPLVLFLHGLASFVQRNGFLSVFLLEVLAAGVFLWFCQKIMALYGAGSLRFAALPLVLAVMPPT